MTSAVCSASARICLRIDVAVRREPHVAVVPFDELDSGDVRQPLRRRPVELELDLPPLRASPQRVEIPGGDDASVVDDRDFLADVLHQFELMTGEEDGGATRSLGAKHVGQRLHGDGVEPGERLVQHQQFRLVQQRRRKLRPLLVAVRELLQLRGRPVAQIEPVEPLGGSRTRLVAAHPVQAPEVGELLADRHPRIEAALLRHVAEAQPLLQSDRPSVPEHLAAVGYHQAEDRAHRRRLPGAVRPEEAEHPTALDGERARVERLNRPVPLT